jgi:hypothetical protein
MDTDNRPSRKVGALLWVVAFLLMATAAVYQRMTGPTHPKRVEYELGGATLKARLLRSGTTDEDASVKVPLPPGGWTGQLVWKRYPTEDEYAEIAMTREEDGLVGRIPRQPPAGKVTYYVALAGVGAERIRVPAEAADDPVLRFKDPVPVFVWVPHILAMFLGLLFAFRAGSAAFLARPEARPLAWWTLGSLFVGGLVLGPILQKYAFGAFWTGWPLGGDLTDNKLLVAWLAWLGACIVLWCRRGTRDRAVRLAVVLAAAVTLVIFLIPHSARGSELDYGKLKDVQDPTDAIKTG